MTEFHVGDIVCDKYDAYNGQLTKGKVVGIYYYGKDEGARFYEIEWDSPREEVARLQDEFYLVPLELAEAYIDESKRIDEKIANGSFGSIDSDLDTPIPTDIIVEKLAAAWRKELDAKKKSKWRRN